MDLSVLIPARNEEWLSRTVENVLVNIRGNSEIIVVLDGAWANPSLQDHASVRLIYRPEPIGQRAATNLAARVASGRYLCKLDAHCAIDEGFDVKLMEPYETGEIGPDVTTIPAMINLHAFNWRCQACGRETYQGPKPLRCETNQNRDRELAMMPPPCGKAAGFERVVVWEPRHRRAKGNGSLGAGSVARTEFWRFDHELHFQYHGPKREGQERLDLADVMSSIGACFVMRRDRFWELGGLDVDHGSWGQVGTELACKSWLSGGRQIVNRRTWFAHMFRTQGGGLGPDGFGFPYAIKPSDQAYAREYSRNLWGGNHWATQVYPLSWLIEYFNPIRGWQQPGEPNETAERAATRVAQLAFVQEAGERFSCNRKMVMPSESVLSSTDHNGRPVTGGALAVSRASVPSIGLLYYSDCRGDARILSVVRRHLKRILPAEWPIVSVTLAPVDFGRNIVLPLERGPITMLRQVLAGLEALDTEVVFFAEHDVAYHPVHFQFRPPRDDVFYYNRHRWQVRASDGRAVHYPASQTSGCCASRRLLLEHYRKRVAYVEAHGYDRNLGFEPGTNKRSLAIDPHEADAWFAAWPNIDIRHGHNLSRSKWSVADFRNKTNAAGWIEGDAVPGWGVTKDRFDTFLHDIETGVAPFMLSSEQCHVLNRQ